MASTPDPENPVVSGSILISSGGKSRKGSSPAGGQIELPIGGREVSVVAVSRFAPFLRLHFHRPEAFGSDFTLEIEGPFRIVANGHEAALVPESGPSPAYLPLVDKTVARAMASADGSLDVEFTDGDRLLIAPHEFEPWQLNGDDGTLVVSVAGGGLAVWEAKRG